MKRCECCGERVAFHISNTRCMQCEIARLRWRDASNWVKPAAAVIAQRDAELKALRAFAQAIYMGPGWQSHESIRHSATVHGLLDANGQPTALLRGDA